MAIMRFVVFFGHRKFRHITSGLVAHNEDIPEDVYRVLAVVIDADSRRAAEERAVEQLGWPHAETDLVPLLTLPQSDVADALRAVALDDGKPARHDGAK